MSRISGNLEKKKNRKTENVICEGEGKHLHSLWKTRKVPNSHGASVADYGLKTLSFEKTRAQKWYMLLRLLLRSFRMVFL